MSKTLSTSKAMRAMDILVQIWAQQQGVDVEYSIELDGDTTFHNTRKKSNCTRKRSKGGEHERNKTPQANAEASE